MIEQNIIEWLDLGDAVQCIDVYTKKKLVKYFSFLRLLIKNSGFPLLYYLIFNFILFFQIITLTIENVPQKNDLLIEIIKYLSKVFTPHVVVANDYMVLLGITSIVIVIDVFLLILIYILKIKGYLKLNFPVYILNIINNIIYYYLFGPAIQIYLLGLDMIHIIMDIILIIMIILYLIIVICYALYNHEIGTLNSSIVLSRIKCNYEIYFTVSRLVTFVFNFVLKNYLYNNKIVKIIYEFYLLINCLSFSVYGFKYVFYFDQTLNGFIHFELYISTWFCFCILLKTLLNLSNITYFTIGGCIFIMISFSKFHKYKRYQLLTEVNIFELTNVKFIEIFNNALLNLFGKSNFKSNILIYGVIKRFTNFIKANPELNDQFIRLVKNKYLLNKFKKENELHVLSIIYIIYSYYLDKSSNKEEIGYNFCYFLVNKFKNISFAISIISKLKINSHKGLFYKYCLMENIKEYLIKKLEKKKFKEPIKHIQMGGVILYNLYIDVFKMDIYEAACSQVDYFDALKNNVTTNKTTRNFLRNGNDILKLRKEIIFLWHKIIELNPFSDEIEKDFLVYLETIIQDEYLAKEEIKKYEELKNNKLSEKNSINNNMFLQDTSTILLIDGYTSNGRILYATPNFPALFMFSGKEILNSLLDDLLPNAIQPFHKYLVDDSLKYSNLHNIFHKPKNVLLKGKNGGLFNIFIFIKPVPNLSYGLIYFSYIQKIIDNNFIIILDKDFKINGFTGTARVGTPFTINNNNYDLSQTLYGHHIGLVIPEILTQINYLNNSLKIMKTDIDLKGSFYPSNNIKGLEPKIDTIIACIVNLNNSNSKNKKSDDLQIFTDEYNNLINKLQNIFGKPISIFYKVELYEYLSGKYKYYRVYITNDLEIENDIIKPGKSKKKLITIKTDASNRSNENKKIMLNVNKKMNEKNDNFLNNKENEEENKNDLNEGEKDNQNNNNEDQNNENISNENEDININENNENKIQKKITKRDNTHKSTFNLNNSLSPNSTGFNKIKKFIIKDKETFIVRTMKCLYFIFVICTVYCMAYNDFQQKKNFQKLAKFFQYNLYFNHSKISIGNLYLIALNFQWLKDGHFNNSECLSQDCIFDILIGVKSIVTDLKNMADLSLEFDDELTKIVETKRNISIDIYKSINKTNDYYIHSATIQNLLISYGIILASMANEFMEDTENFLKNDRNEVTLNNLVKLTYDAYNYNISGLIGEKKMHKINRDFFSFPSYFAVSSVIALCLIIIYTYFFIKMYNIEIYFLDKLIAFTSPNFEIYLKKLDEIKKKFRNDNNEDEEKSGDELDEIGSKKNSKEDEDGKKSKDGNINNNKNKERHKKRGKKQNKIQQQRINKKKIMSKYFRNSNIILGIKILSVLILSFIYYITTLIIKYNFKKIYLKFDEVNNSIEGIFKEAIDVYLSYKNEVAKYEVESKNCKCTNAYTMEIPDNFISSSQIGNLILPLTKSNSYNPKTVERLTSLYNGNACSVLEDANQSGYEQCASFMSGILLKGMEQSIMQMGIIINSVKDELREVNEGTRNLKNLLKNSFYDQFETFVGHFMIMSYFKTNEIYNDLRNEKLNYILSMFNLIFFVCFVVILILLFILLYFIHSSNYVFNSFFNFIAIFPDKYINEDEDLFQEIINLEKNIY